MKASVDRHGLEMLRPRERRKPRMPNQLSAVVEERILAFAIAHPGLGPRRIASELRRKKWGGIVVSPNGVWRCLIGAAPGKTGRSRARGTTRASASCRSSRPWRRGRAGACQAWAEVTAPKRLQKERPVSLRPRPPPDCEKPKKGSKKGREVRREALVDS